MLPEDTVQQVWQPVLLGTAHSTLMVIESKEENGNQTPKELLTRLRNLAVNLQSPSK